MIAWRHLPDDATREEAAPKIKRMGAWARRVGGVKALGLGEFNAADRERHHQRHHRAGQ